MATQRTKIYIEGVALDLDKDVDIDFTYSIADIDNFDKRTTTFSKTINIPGTAHNNFLFGNYFDFNIENAYSDSLDNVGVNYNPLKKAFAKVTLDNIEIFAGVLRILEIKYQNGQINYECALFGSLNSLFSTLGESKLSDLDLDELTHTYNWTNINTTWDDPANEYVYPLVEYGYGNATANSYGYHNFRAAINVKYLFNKIIDSAGYTYNSEIWDDNHLDRIVILNNEAEHTTYPPFYEANASLTPLTIATTALTTSYPTFDVSSATYLTIDTTTGGYSRIKNATASNITFDLNYSISYSWSVPSSDNDSTSIVYLERRNDSNITLVENTTQLVSLNSDIQNRENGSRTRTGVTRVTLEPGDGINLKIITDLDDAGSTLSFLTTSFLSVDALDVTKRVAVNWGDSINGRSIPPEGMKQSDFLKSIINALNLYIVSNPINELDLVMTPYPDFYLDEQYDWSEKKSIKNGVSIKPPSEWVPKNYNFKYLSDSDYYSNLYKNKYNIEYGSYILATSNQFSKDDSSFELSFSLVPSVGNNNNNRIVPAMFDLDDSGNYKQVKTNAKLSFFYGRKTSNASYTVKDGATTLATTSDFGLASHIYDPYTTEDGTLWDLSFMVPNEIYYTSSAFYPEANLFSKYYETYISDKSNKDAKLVTLYLLLKPIDMLALNFRKLVKVDSGLYFINKIDGYNPLGNELTKVELLRVTNG